MIWVRHGKNPGWFRSLPPGEQAFLVAADVWNMEQESKPRTKNGATTMTLEQVARLGRS